MSSALMLSAFLSSAFLSSKASCCGVLVDAWSSKAFCLFLGKFICKLMPLLLLLFCIMVCMNCTIRSIGFTLLDMAIEDDGFSGSDFLFLILM